MEIFLVEMAIAMFFVKQILSQYALQATATTRGSGSLTKSNSSRSLQGVFGMPGGNPENRNF